MRNTQRQKQRGMRSTTVTLRCVNATAELGRSFVTDTVRRIRCARCASEAASSPLPKRYTTSNRCPTVERTPRTTSCPFARSATPRLLHGKAADGFRNTDGRGGLNLHEPPLTERAPPFVQKKCVSNDLLNPSENGGDFKVAKDGTNRGGRRVRSGGKPDALADKIINGKSAKVMGLPYTELDGSDDLGEVSELEGNDMPNPSEYLSAMQRDGKPLGADIIFKETWEWLKNRGCEKFVNPRLLESYSQAFARFIQCEQAVTDYGLLGKHPTTGGAITSPFVTMSQSFQKQANVLWYEIFDIVKQNCTTAFVGNPQDDMMERLLSARKGK